MRWQQRLQACDGVARGSHLVADGLSRHTLLTRIRSGSWQRVLPDVVIAHSGPPTVRQLRRAALLYGGPAAVLSHASAAALFGLVPEHDGVDVTVPHGRRRQDREFVRIHQSARPHRHVTVRGLPCSLPARSVVDLGCTLWTFDEVSGLVSRAVQSRVVTVAQLRAELALAPRRGSLHLRRVVEDVADGSRSFGESQFLHLVRRAGLPEPRLNAPIRTAGGVFVADALWKEARLIVEIDGAAWHLDAVSWRRDLRRQNLLHNAGYRILRFPVQRLRDDPDGVIAELRAALQRAA